MMSSVHRLDEQPLAALITAKMRDQAYRTPYGDGVMF